MNNQSSIDILAMFIISTLHDSRDQSKQQCAKARFNHTSDITIQVELQQLQMKFQNYQSVQSMSMI